MSNSYSFHGEGQENKGYDHHGEESSKQNGTTPSKDIALPIENGKKKMVEKEEEEDPWNVETLRQDYVHWHELTTKQKVIRSVVYPVKLVLVFGFLYLFICSLDFLSSSFKLLGGKKAGEVFQQSHVLTNPVAGLMMGVLVTVLVQSSSTSTSIVISMVGADILTPRTAVPIVMGANIGTSVTNTIVAMGQIADKADFRRAFAGATVHDMFNWMTVLIFLPLEVFTGYLYYISGQLVDSLHLKETLDVNQDLLKTITKPFTTLIVQVSSSGIKKIATGDVKAEDATLMKLCCDKVKPDKCCSGVLGDPAKVQYGGPARNYSTAERESLCMAVDTCAHKEYSANDTGLADCASKPWSFEKVTEEFHANTLSCAVLGGNSTEMGCCNDKLVASSFYSDFARNASNVEKVGLCSTINSTCYGSDVYNACMGSWAIGREKESYGDVFSCKTWAKEVETTCNKPCEFVFRSTHVSDGGPLTDEAVGGILLVISLFLLCSCLVAIVKLLHSLLQGPMAKVIKKFVNADFPGYCGYFTGYLAILLGAGMTILVQSSSIFTSTLTPLVGMGVITLDRMYPLTLGSNIGTTFTGILSALAQDANSIPRSLQVAFCHLFFNVSGIIVFYPLPFFRPPIPAAKFLGNTTAKYRWFAIIYLIGMFFLLPLSVFGLSILGWYVLAAVLIPIGAIAITVGIIKCIQAKRPGCLPAKLRSWKFLPRPLRSLEPYNNMMKKVCFCSRFQDEPKAEELQVNGVGTKGDGGHEFDNVITKL